MHFRVAKITVILSCAWLILAGCASSKSAPVETRQRTGEVATSSTTPKPVVTAAAKAPVVDKRNPNDPRPKTHTVQKGENLYRISLEYGFDYRELAEWNGLSNVNDIKVGQVLTLVAPTNGVVTKPLSDMPSANNTANNGISIGNIDSPKAIKLPYSESNKVLIAQAGAAPVVVKEKPATDKPSSTKPAVEKTPPAKEKVASAPVDQKPSGTNAVDGLTWMWPTSGKVVGQFNESKQLKGLDIAGKKGQPINAAEEGKVVYSGSSLRGYGKFIIIKHESDYLSVYAHNDKLLVKEGQKVTRGQKIAEMGDSETDQVKLHFEIRRYGKPVDPAKILPEK